MAKDILFSLIGLAAASFMLYFPYFWQRRTCTAESDWGLAWFMTRESWTAVITMLLITLVPLTFVSANWPPQWGRGGPHSPDLLSVLNSLGGGIAAAFIEETFYRGWLQTITVRKFGVVLGIFLATLCFALSHLVVLVGWLRVATFFPGLVMGWLRWRHGSVLPAIIYHAVCNVWAVWWAPIP